MIVKTWVLKSGETWLKVDERNSSQRVNTSVEEEEKETESRIYENENSGNSLRKRNDLKLNAKIAALRRVVLDDFFNRETLNQLAKRVYVLYVFYFNLTKLSYYTLT